MNCLLLSQVVNISSHFVLTISISRSMSAVNQKITAKFNKAVVKHVRIKLLAVSHFTLFKNKAFSGSMKMFFKTRLLKKQKNAFFNLILINYHLGLAKKAIIKYYKNAKTKLQL